MKSVDKILIYLEFEKEGNAFFMSYTYKNYIVEINFLETIPYTFMILFGNKPPILIHQSHYEEDFYNIIYEYFNNDIRKIKIKKLLY